MLLSNVPKCFINQESLDCPICYKQTDGIKLTFHAYLTYYFSIFDYADVKDGISPLIQCIKCSNAMCIPCMRKLNYCPFNCNSINKPKTNLGFRDNRIRLGHLVPGYNYEIKTIYDYQ